MKKSILASSIAAAMFGLGAVGAHAAILESQTGAGDMLLVPYFSAQAENATLLSITNTDTQSGKAVKVRFRGAANSDDIFDFQVFLSPMDVWTANVSKGADGKARLFTNDASCTKPAASVLNSTPFITSRLDQRLTGDALANGTREGYIEIIGMADIPPHRKSGSDFAAWTGLRGTPAADPQVVAGTKTVEDNPLWTAIKHVNGVAPCVGTAWTDLDKTTSINLSNLAGGTGPALGLTPISGGLVANWAIVNTVNAAAWGGEATALVSNAATRDFKVPNGPINIIYAPQIESSAASVVANWSADPLFLPANTVNQFDATNLSLKLGVGTAPAVNPGYYDLPDLSTALDAPLTQANAALQVNAIAAAITPGNVMNEFAVESAINGATDWVFSMPSRRYSVAMAYNKITATDDGRRWNNALNGTNGTPSNVFQLSNTSLENGLICVNSVKPTPYDREERTPVSSQTVVVSPSTVAGGTKLCGETSVMSFNNGTGASGALKASVAVTAVDVTYQAGWATMAMPYPAIGGAFQRASMGAQGFGLFRNYR